MTHDTPTMEIIGSFRRFTLTWFDRCTGVCSTKTIYAQDAEWAVCWMRGSLRDKCALSGRDYQSGDYDVTAAPAGAGV